MDTDDNKSSGDVLMYFFVTHPRSPPAGPDCSSAIAAEVLDSDSMGEAFKKSEMSGEWLFLPKTVMAAEEVAALPAFFVAEK